MLIGNFVSIAKNVVLLPEDTPLSRCFDKASCLKEGIFSRFKMIQGVPLPLWVAQLCGTSCWDGQNVGFEGYNFF